MTVVEFFACAPIENMVSCFMLHPNKVIFVGGGRKARRRLYAYEQLALRMGINATFEHRAVAVNSINDIVECLTDIINTEESCCFDLTGGDDLALVAMGIVYERYKDTHNLQMQRYNFNSRRMADCDGDGATEVKMPFPNLTVAENVSLHGGIINHGVRADSLVNREDVKAAWRICRSAPVAWNKNTALLSDFLGFAKLHNNGLSVVVADGDGRARYGDYNRKRGYVLKFLRSLEEAGLVLKLKEIKDSFSFEFKNSTVKKLVSKSGNSLEYKILDIVSSMKDNQGKSVFSDSVCGAVVDWDGVTAKDGASFGGAVNEVDVLAMKGITPVFISCKNGGVDDSELYKLNAVAEHFGNKYAKKLLIASGLNKTGQGLMYFKERAKELNVLIVDNAHKLSDKDIQKILLKI